MSDWDVIGGDPAPGSPDSIAAAEAVLSKVSSMASEARQSLLSAAGDLDVSRWRGTAADVFRRDISALPTELADVVVSYEEASAALSAYRRALQSAQQEAAGVRAAATQAAADASQASAQQAQAQMSVAGLRSQLNSAMNQLSVLRKQLALATDPATHATLQTSANSAQSSVMRYESDLRSAQSAHDRHAGDAAEARDRFDRAIGQAESIRSEVGSAVTTAAELLARAERDAQLPSVVQRTMSELRETIVEYGPVLADTLQLGASLFAMAAVILPFGAPVLLACALICAAGSLAVAILADSLSPGGFTPDRLLDLGVKTLTLITLALIPEAGLVAKGAGLVARSSEGVATVVKGAAVFAKGAGWAANGLSAAQAYEEHGQAGLEFAAGGMVLGFAGSRFAGSKAGGVLAGNVIGSVKKSPTLTRLLQGVSKDVANSHGTVLSIPLVSHSPYVQSLYGVGSVKGGEFLTGPVIKTGAQGHALSSSALAAKVGEDAEAATDGATSLVTDVLPPDPEKEIDINLPIRGSGARPPASGAGGSR